MTLYSRVLHDMRKMMHIALLSANYYVEIGDTRALGCLTLVHLLNMTACLSISASTELESNF